MAVVTRFAASGIEQTRYLHRDHLASVVLITDSAGRTAEEQAFDAFGAATIKGSLNPSPWRVSAVAHITTHRGYTGHEMLDHLGLIHMNGRVYDPEIGRFLSADPFVQYPASTQGYNRYSYLNNNPLNATDPSGYFNLKKELGNLLGQGGEVGHIVVASRGMSPPREEIYVTRHFENPYRHYRGMQPRCSYYQPGDVC